MPSRAIASFLLIMLQVAPLCASGDPASNYEAHPVRLITGEPVGALGEGTEGVSYRGSLYLYGLGVPHEGCLLRVSYPFDGVSCVPMQAESHPRWLYATSTYLYFTAEDPEHGREIWISDGTAAGTRRLSDLRSGSASSFGLPFFTEMNGLVFFKAMQESQHHLELGVTDGTEAGTRIVKDINQTWADHSPQDLTPFGDALLFVHTSALQSSRGEIWKTDGTEPGTVLVKDIIEGPEPGSCRVEAAHLKVVADDLVLFRANDCVHGRELWKTDGTTGGTRMLKDINPLFEEAGVNGFLGGRTGSVFFLGDEGVHGTELWKSDGSEDGTALVRDINPGPASSWCYHSSSTRPFIGDSFIFSADDGIHGCELWRSDGTEDGTQMIKDITPDWAYQSSKYWITGAANTAVFWADDGVHGVEVWITDGTEAGTVLVDDIKPGTSDAKGRWTRFVYHQGHVYFEADPFLIQAGDLYEFSLDSALTVESLSHAGYPTPKWQEFDVNLVFADRGEGVEHTAYWYWGDDTPPEQAPIQGGPGLVEGSHSYLKKGTYTGEVTVVSDADDYETRRFVAEVYNTDPEIPTIEAPLEPVLVGTEIIASATFIDPDTMDTHTATWDWGDCCPSAGTVIEGDGSGSVNGTKTYHQTGVYSVTLTVRDDDGGSGHGVFNYVVVYDPDGGFVTGGGWYDSPSGAYLDDPALTGKANFGFVSKYQQGAQVPMGETEFQFKVADLNFHSDSYQWLVVAGAKAKFKGEGTINGLGSYGFMITAIDGRLPGGGGTDKFRIKIWDKEDSDAVVYDNELGASEEGEPSTPIGGGSIVIHK